MSAATFMADAYLNDVIFYLGEDNLLKMDAPDSIANDAEVMALIRSHKQAIQKQLEQGFDCVRDGLTVAEARMLSERDIVTSEQYQQKLAIQSVTSKEDVTFQKGEKAIYTNGCHDVTVQNTKSAKCERKVGELGADGKIIRAETTEEKDNKVEAKKPRRRGSL